MQRRTFLAGLLGSTVAGVAFAGELLNLTTPETGPSITNWQVITVRFGWVEQRIDIVLLGTNGEQRAFAYTGSEATTLMKALNKVDLSVKSLQRRILERLVSDGKFAGTILGSPD